MSWQDRYRESRASTVRFNMEVNRRTLEEALAVADRAPYDATAYEEAFHRAVMTELRERLFGDGLSRA